VRHPATQLIEQPRRLGFGHAQQPGDKLGIGLAVLGEPVEEREDGIVRVGEAVMQGSYRAGRFPACIQARSAAPPGGYGDGAACR
jgi:hypothetical protein